MVPYVLSDFAARSWDLHGIGYPSALRVDIPGVWAADPDLSTIATSFRTALSLPPLRDYSCLALVAHSMGGLVVQRALLDDATLRRKVSHLLLFGTPSHGLEKAGFASGLKRQLRDMSSGGQFITKLREDWTSQFGTSQHFVLKAVAGDTDEFVPASSSLSPFPDVCRAVVSGNHLSIIRPVAPDHGGLKLLLDTLGGSGSVPAAIDGARLAVELGKFREAVTTLLPRAAELDEAALASLALALEGLDRRPEALNVLEEHGRGGKGLSTTDAVGILAGRLKRRWLVERGAGDLGRARDLYVWGLEESERKDDHDQAYYHAINVAFLDLISLPFDQPVPKSVQDMATRAKEHCMSAAIDHWQMATMAEADLMLGDLSGAETLYRQALARANSPRAVQSMYSQAIRVAERMFGERGSAAIEKLFGLDSPSDR
jgi:pimeloyl-ACP methyl ester carboxylesterase